MLALARGIDGQSTLEYALITFALLTSIAVLGLLVGFMRAPATFGEVIGSSAHVLAGSDVLGAVQDLAVF